MPTATADTNALYRARKGRVDFVDVPEFGYLMIEGSGAPHTAEGRFQTAIQALFAVSYAAHFIVRNAYGEAPRVMPLEALWWVAGSDPTAFENAAPEAWRWRALVMQPAPIDQATVGSAVDKARTKVADLTVPHFRRWREGRCAQTMHVGPYDAEAPTIVALHRAIRDAGCRPRGHHHEIYLGDPRRSAPEKLRTLLRQPVDPAPGGSDRA